MTRVVGQPTLPLRTPKILSGFLKATIGGILILISGLAGFSASAQSAPDADGTRQLYYLSGGNNPSRSETTHLGLKYSLVLVKDRGMTVPIPADRVLQKGDCFAINLEANRAGHLYVLAKQSSSVWRPILPSSDMAGETSMLDPGKRVRLPLRDCFAIEDPPGSETLFVILSRDAKDYYELYSAIKERDALEAAAAESKGKARVQETGLRLADSRLNHAVDDMTSRFGSRDIVIRKMSDLPSRTDQPESVYVVNASSKATTSISATIVVKHR